MQHSVWLLCMQTFWAKSIEDRAKVDLKLHFMKKTLNEVVSMLWILQLLLFFTAFCHWDTKQHDLLRHKHAC